jgi:hypothetical protein
MAFAPISGWEMVALVSMAAAAAVFIGPASRNIFDAARR